MDFCINTHNAHYFSSVEEIPEEIWHSLDCIHNVYFHPNYLSALANNHPEIEFSYVVLFDEINKPIAFSTIQIVNFQLESVQNKSELFLEKVKCLVRNLGVILPKKPFKIITCGNTFVSGEHGIFIKQNQNKQAVIKELAKAVLHFVNSNPKLKKEISAYMLKDFVKESLVITNELHECNYYSFNVEPNMIMSIDGEWQNFTDYLADMKTKFRVKAKKAMERSFVLETIDISEENIEDYLSEMTYLYKNVSSKAGFNLGEFNIQSYRELKNNLGENYVIKAYFLKNKLVGFLSAIVNQKTLDAHFVGIDYQYNREYAIYQRMLYDYVDIAIQRKLCHINFGRTASEIKSSVGAVPQDLTIYLRHKNTIPNRFLSLLLSRIEPTPFHQNYPFKVKNFVAQV
ncbi:hypothetical protein C7447_101593 [Tenacibaculum adriaticum]|uniref:Peptidoglycan biosynthesis/recognition protein n=1 Tax=Tenacibaculum adriaticum TaxID=413713 RepID=A0A5S5DVX2_9FLAO|nr:GNAT family N-acetyltransferase [Tenacibaculum adriaticum]TYP99985.1 hypothetical protein C7447_101593 [Tenacibaculum adriaticum]